MSETWSALTRQLVDHIINRIATPALAEAGADGGAELVGQYDPEQDAGSVPRQATVNAQCADLIFIEQGLEDFEYGAAIFGILDHLDALPRERAYQSLYHLLRGTLNIAGSATTPVNAVNVIAAALDAAAGKRLRQAKAAGQSAKEEAINRAIVTSPGRTAKERLRAVNATLQKAGIAPISERQYYRHSAKLKERHKK